MLNFTNVSVFLAEKGQYFEIKNIITPVNILCFLWLNNINQEEKKEKKNNPEKNEVHTSSGLIFPYNFIGFV